MIVAVLMTVEAGLDTFFPSTIKMRARVISSMSTTKDSAYVRIKRHLVSIIFRPLFAVFQISFLHSMLQKVLRIAVFLSDEVIGEKRTNRVLAWLESWMPASVKPDKPGALRGMAQTVIGSVVGNYQSLVTQRNTNVAMTKVGSYIPAWQAESTPITILTPASPTEKKRASNRGSGR